MLVLQGAKSAVHSVAFSPGGGRIAAGCDHGAVQVWDLSGRERIRHDWWGDVIHKVAFLSEDRLLSTLGGISLRVIDVPSGGLDYCRWVNQGYGWAFALSPDRAALCVSQRGRVSRWSLSDRPRERWATPSSPDRVTALDWSADGKTVAIGRDDGRVMLRRATTGSRIEVLGEVDAPVVHDVALSPDGRTLAWTAGPRLCLHRRSHPAGTITHRLGRTHFQGVAWNPSGAFFATANNDGKIDFWDAASGQRRASFDWGVGKVHAVTFDAAGDRAACGSETGAVVVWDVDD
jgi:WD40 repeat protein